MAMTEEEIIMLIRTGGKALDAGVKALYQSTAQAMLRFFVYQGVSGQDAQDILQDTVVKIVRSADSYGGTGTAKAWIWQRTRAGLCADPANGRAEHSGNWPAHWAHEAAHFENSPA